MEYVRFPLKGRGNEEEYSTNFPLLFEERDRVRS
jgi:hypothetical protein